eukprot:CAMPEP_0198240558 /NCGR_PEP_ID=MMETSP1446-20131203/5631_1 /TAXON_ID=1461542 ORGANISM="Unidentified sp, Strain CCMP2111" /NCGR_SAMPLE_ID=MMETSP1446 /ASSEMBLY_ACC=CAM_ASM_001112 /LENGTH=352 /DNA_ID=CAMNT_0043923297 /DNA_START=79 /DNA_END=1137 /DNA_ORIENTATION=+
MADFSPLGSVTVSEADAARARWQTTAPKRSVEAGEDRDGGQQQEKKLKTEAAGSPRGADEVQVKLSDSSKSPKYAQMKWYSGRKFIDLRNYFIASDGLERPTKKGISLNADQWRRLVSLAPDISQAFESDGSDYSEDLGNLRKVSVQPFKNSRLVNIREYYTKDGELAPGSKGIALTQDQWQTLVVRMGDLSRSMEDSSAAPPTASGSGPSATAGDEEKLKLALSDTRFVKVRSFKGAWLVDVREYYTKDGNLLPGRKGISLSTSQWETLAGSARAVTDALASAEANPSFEVELGKNKKVTLSNFKGSSRVDIREWYEKDGTSAPGKKGISLSMEQWEKLEQSLAQVNAALA